MDTTVVKSELAKITAAVGVLAAMDSGESKMKQMKLDYQAYFKEVPVGSKPIPWCEGTLTRVDGGGAYQLPNKPLFTFTPTTDLSLLYAIPEIHKSFDANYPGAFKFFEALAAIRTAVTNITAQVGVVVPPVKPPVVVNPPSSGKIVWLKSKAEAFAAAKSQGKKVLLLVGSRCCDGTLFMRDQACEWTSPANVKGLIEQHFIPWYGGAYYNVPGCEGDPVTSDWNSYAMKGQWTMPLIVVIDPNTGDHLGENSYGITPRVGNQFDNQKFYDRLVQYI